MGNNFHNLIPLNVFIRLISKQSVQTNDIIVWFRQKYPQISSCQIFYILIRQMLKGFGARCLKLVKVIN